MAIVECRLLANVVRFVLVKLILLTSFISRMCHFPLLLLVATWVSVSSNLSFSQHIKDIVRKAHQCALFHVMSTL